ncbi:MAG TPA: right-handed parallel beta-helix repeat-containing protein, partial [Pirellulales bacterium]|nr:right-handed parallel beta-helix repeat-containing protein [Pirellulales bacterium]
MAGSLSAGLGSPRRALSVEPLEDRRLLSVTTAYVAPAADYTDPNNPGNPQPGDTVTWNGGGQFTSPVPGLIFGTDAFTSIAAAVANVSSGGTVDVAPGTYDEHDIVINQALTLNGPNFGLNPNTATRGAEATIDAQMLGGDIVINANNVTVDGFTIQDGQNGSAAGVVMYNTTSGVQVLNNIITNNQIGIYADSDGPSMIQGNLITGNNLSGAAGGTGIYSDSNNGLTIDSNVFTNQTINSAMTFDLGTHTNLQVTNNAINNPAPGNSAIYVFDADGAVFADNDIATQNDGTALHLAGGDSNVSVHNNNFDTVTNGVSVTDDGPGANTTITVNDNSFTNASSAALSIGAGGYTGTLDASKNWWGDISGPTIASNVGGLGQTIVDPLSQVTYRPWLIYGTDADPTVPGFQLPTTVTVTSQSDVSAAVNDFTLLQNAIGAAAAGQTIDLSGPFDWTAANAAAAYAASTNTAPTGDIRGIALPDGVNNLTITSSASNATITGVGDSSDAAYNAFVFSAVNGAGATGNDNLTVSNLNIDNFESGVFLGWNNGGAFNSTLVKNNTITVAGDSDNNQADGFQSIAVYFWNGHNQTMTGNTIDFMGNGTRTAGNGAFSYGFQDGTTGGTGYDGLSIDHNIFKLLPSAVGGTETVTGVWENGHNDDNASHLSIADNQFLGIPGRQLDIGLQLSSQTSNMAIDGNTFTDVKYVYWVGAHNGDANGDQFTFTNNMLTRVGDANGVFLQNVDAVTHATITINWNTNNTIDGFTGIRGLNELSVQATGQRRPSGAATDLNAVNGVGSMPVDFVNTNWGSPARFANPLTTPDGTPGPIAYGFNT